MTILTKSKKKRQKDLTLHSKSCEVLGAWILDAQIEHNGIRLWFITPKGKRFSALYSSWCPSFYIALDTNRGNKNNNEEELAKYYSIIEGFKDNLDIKSMVLTYRRIRAEDIENSPALQITVHSPFKYKKVIKLFYALEMFKFYNTDLPLAQLFFYETNLFPFAYCQVSIKLNPSPLKTHNHSKNNLLISKLDLNDSNEKIEYSLPPLRIIWLDFTVNKQGLRISKSDPITTFTISEDPGSIPLDLFTMFHPSMVNESLSQNGHKVQQIIINEGREIETLRMMETAIKRIDPDIIYTSHGDEQLFPYLMARTSYHRIANDYTLSRDNAPLKNTLFEVNKGEGDSQGGCNVQDAQGNNSFMSYGTVYHRAEGQYYLNGRLHIDSAVYGGLNFETGNIHGIAEVARVSYVPLQRLTRITIGGALQSLQFYNAFKQGILVPEVKKNSEYFQDAFSLLSSDRGGHIIQPKVGFFNRVAELDFTSMYPSLMVEYNVSPEALMCSCCKETGHQVPGLSYYTCKNRKGIVPLSIKLPLVKRIAYKKMALKLKAEHGSKKEIQKYSDMESALKWILVVCFGYLGFRNARFGRIEAHQTVCAYAREFLLNAMSIIENHGLKIIHGIVDSLYVQAPESMTTEQFHEVCHIAAGEIEEKTKIPISFSPKHDYFSLIAFLPTKANAKVGALSRYWGVKPSGAVKVRGVELRRRDSPPLIKQFQLEAIDMIADVMNTAGISVTEDVIKSRKLLLKELVVLLRKYFLMLERDEVKTEELAIKIRMTRTPDQYKVNNYQAIAGKWLERMGIQLFPGQNISFIIKNDKSPDPFNRVIPLEMYLYNKEKRALKGEKVQKQMYDIDKYKELLVRALVNLFPFPLPEKTKVKLQNISGENKKKLKQKTLIL